ncbi:MULTISPECIES: hypothetical protein [Vibrio]|uniref:hypothetical protein n=1 Tax=Vibrio TaxID=662 RepID=UPI000907AEE7|nr:hypothetical protein [Vibrio sinaloensis]
MVRLPAFSFSISGRGEASSDWPASLNFPLVPSGQEFSIMGALPRKPTVMIFTIDLSQVLRQSAPSRVIH